ncbi:MAG TPA: amidase [Candidatus Udaeobacter sp.]|nr:amidase [Candidatus Udaeobacter sp.]
MTLSRRFFLQGSVAGMAALAFSKKAPAQMSSGKDKSELHYLTVAEAARMIRQRKLSPVEYTEAILKRIDAVEPKVHAFITVTREQALETAKTAEKEIMAGKYRGPLHGIPFGVKDTHYTAGIKTTVATPVLADFVPNFDATVVARLKKAGGILMGKTNLPEFSFGGETPGTSNPWDLKRSPGGSSGGSGAALAAGELPAATGGDTSGSIRGPAALNGVVGMMSTYGRVSRYGVAVICWSLDRVGPMTRSIEDNAMMLNILAGYDPLDNTSADAPVPDYTRSLKRGVKGVRIGIPKSPWFEGFHADVMKAYEDGISIYKKLGAKILEVDLPATMEVVDQMQRIIRISEAASYHEPFITNHVEKYGKSNVRRDVEAGSLIPAVHYLRGQRVRKIFIKEMNELYRDIDLLLTPGRAAPAGLPEKVKQNFSRMWNVSGFPALVIPAGFTTDPAGLPTALQLGARPFEEELLYGAGYAYESETHWWDKQKPSV